MKKRAQVINLPPNLLQRIDMLRPAAEQISASLRVAILDMTLQPGQIISEAELGNTFGASRTPVREAISLLREQGLIVTYPSRGNFVSKLSIPDIRGSQFVRQSVELSVVDHLCEDGLPDTAASEIDANLRDQEKCAENGGGPEFHLLDDQFHATLAEAVGQSRIATVIEREKARLDRLRVMSLSSSENLAVLLGDHREIFESILARDQAKARACMVKHLSRVLDTLSDLHDEHRDYFEVQ